MVRNHFFIRPIIKNLCYKLVGGWGKLSFQCLRPSASLRAAGKKSQLMDYMVSLHFISWGVLDNGPLYYTVLHFGSAVMILKTSEGQNCLKKFLGQKVQFSQASLTLSFAR
jgi:hypothetical protein